MPASNDMSALKSSAPAAPLMAPDAPLQKIKVKNGGRNFSNIGTGAKAATILLTVITLPVLLLGIPVFFLCAYGFEKSRIKKMHKHDAAQPPLAKLIDTAGNRVLGNTPKPAQPNSDSKPAAANWKPSQPRGPAPTPAPSQPAPAGQSNPAPQLPPKDPADVSTNPADVPTNPADVPKDSAPQLPKVDVATPNADTPAELAIKKTLPEFKAALSQISKSLDELGKNLDAVSTTKRTADNAAVIHELLADLGSEVNRNQLALQDLIATAPEGLSDADQGILSEEINFMAAFGFTFLAFADDLAFPTEGFAVLGDAPLSSALELKGIQNIGNSCYMNASLQALLAVPGIKARIMSDWGGHEEDRALRSAMQAFVKALDSSKKPDHMEPHAVRLRQAIYDTGVFLDDRRIGAQQDAGDVVDLLLRRLGVSLSIEETVDVVEGGLRWQNVRREQQPILTLPINPAGDNNVQQLCNDHFITTQIANDSPPEQVVLKFGRLVRQNGAIEKVGNALTLPANNILDLTAAFGGKAAKYKIVSAVHHVGDAKGGHYTAFVEKEDGWYHANDSRIPKAANIDKSLSEAYMFVLERVS